MIARRAATLTETAPSSSSWMRLGPGGSGGGGEIGGGGGKELLELLELFELFTLLELLELLELLGLLEAGDGDGLLALTHALGGPSVEVLPSTRLKPASHAVAPLNIPVEYNGVNNGVLQPVMFRLNAGAFSNMYAVPVTFEVSHDPIS
tara:strand:- start:149 stop:595 length:447 start_codon:yes stop_codon:yes gene_type:complete